MASFIGLSMGAMGMGMAYDYPGEHCSGYENYKAFFYGSFL